MTFDKVGFIGNYPIYKRNTDEGTTPSLHNALYHKSNLIARLRKRNYIFDETGDRISNSQTVFKYIIFPLSFNRIILFFPVKKRRPLCFFLDSIHNKFNKIKQDVKIKM